MLYVFYLVVRYLSVCGRGDVIICWLASVMHGLMDKEAMGMLERGAVAEEVFHIVS